MTKEIVLPNSVVVKEEPVFLSYYEKDDTPATRYTVVGKDIEIVHEEGASDCTIMVNNHISVVDVEDLSVYFSALFDD